VDLINSTKPPGGIFSRRIILSGNLLIIPKPQKRVLRRGVSRAEPGESALNFMRLSSLFLVVPFPST